MKSPSRSRRLAALLVGVALIPPVGLLALALASRSSVPAGLEDGRLRECPGTPNCASSEAGTEQEFLVSPLAFGGDPLEAFDSLVKFLDAELGAERVELDEGYAHYVFTTPVLRFRDDLELRLDIESSCVQIRSASRVGRSDLGANRERIESIRSRWQP